MALAQSFELIDPNVKNPQTGNGSGRSGCSTYLL
jgi:hypothetical protein